MIIAMPRDTSDHPERVYMEEITRELKRHRSTVVTWERFNSFPERLAFHRDAGGWRYWTREQLEQARAWMNAVDEDGKPLRRRAPHSASNAA
jgi:hypothetical protein